MISWQAIEDIIQDKTTRIVLHVMTWNEVERNYHRKY